MSMPKNSFYRAPVTQPVKPKKRSRRTRDDIPSRAKNLLNSTEAAQAGASVNEALTAGRARALNPQLAESELNVARARSRSNDPAGAAEAASRALELDPQLPEAELIIAWAGWRKSDANVAEAAANRALALNPRLAEAELIVAWARSRSDDPARAEESAKRALALKPQLAEAELIIAWARSRSNDLAGAEEAAKRALALNPQLAQAELIVARSRCSRFDPTEAEEAARRALSLDPKLASAAHIAAQAATMQGDVDRTVGYYRHLADLEPDNARWPLKIVAALDLGGRVPQAKRELDGVLNRWPSNRLVERFLELSWLGGKRMMEAIEAEPKQDLAPGDAAGAETDQAIASVRQTEWRISDLRALFKTSPRDADLVRPIVVDQAESDVLIAECVGAETLVVVFTGTNDRVWLPLPLFDRYLAALGVSAVYLKDFRRMLFVQGVQSFGEGYEATIAALRTVKRRLRAKRLCTIGHSGGGRAAIRYGVELEAANIVSIAGATGAAPCLDPAAYPRDQITHSRTLRHAGSEMLDLKPFLESQRFASKIALVHGANSASEVANALYLSAIRGVTLHPIPGPSPTIMSLARQGDFVQTLGNLFGVQATPAGCRRGSARSDTGGS
jgi:Tfp pilus assembly protein PilF